MRRIAMWIHGGIGGGYFAQGQPAIQQLVARLAHHFQIDVYSLLPPGENFVPSGFNMFYLRREIQWRFLRWLYLVAKFFRESRGKPYRLVYGFWGYPAGSMAVVLGLLYKIPSVVHLQGGDAVRIPSLKYGVFYNPLRAKICRFTYSHCAHLIALTAFQASCLKTNRVIKAPLIIPFGPDHQHFSYREERFHHAVVRFLSVGNQTPVKGQDTMLKVFSIVANRIPSKLVIIGEDYYEGTLQELCASLGIQKHVRFLGPQPHAVMPDFYQNADILLHTPLYEGQGIVFAEAAACGTIIAGTAVGMLSDMGDDGALLAPPGEAEMLADKIIAALSDKESLKKMQESAKRWVVEKDVNYTEYRILETLNELFPHADSKKFETSAGKAER